MMPSTYKRESLIRLGEFGGGCFSELEDDETHRDLADVERGRKCPPPCGTARASLGRYRLRDPYCRRQFPRPDRVQRTKDFLNQSQSARSSQDAEPGLGNGGDRWILYCRRRCAGVY